MVRKRDTWIYRTAYRWGAIWMGTPFIAAGSYFTLAGLEILPLHGKANAPLWVIAAVGFSFFLAGLLLFVRGIQGVLVQRRRRWVAEVHPDKPWLLDFDWNQDGVRDRTAARWCNTLVGLVLFSVFLAPFNWWAFASGEGPVMVVIITVLFDLIPVWLLYCLLRQVGQHLKYGSTRLRFLRFPYAPGETVEVVFSPNRFGALDCALRFVEERFEQTGSGDNRSTRHVVDKHYENQQRIEVTPTEAEVSLSFDLPDNPEWVNGLSQRPVRYWELEIHAEAPGIDFQASFPLPVYAESVRPKTSKAAAAPTA